MDFSFVIPRGVGIASGLLAIFNRADLSSPAVLVTAGPVSVRGRTLYATITAQGGADGNDYLLRWVAIDTDGNRWPRTALMLVAQTS